jgi:cell division protein FtsB
MPRPKPRGKRRPWILWALVALAGFVAFKLTRDEVGDHKLRAQIGSLHAQIDSLHVRNAELEAEKKRLLTDTAYIERLARKELGMAKPGEKVYRFVTPAGKESGKDSGED